MRWSTYKISHWDYWECEKAMPIFKYDKLLAKTKIAKIKNKFTILIRA